jgi:ATP-dependent DNA helicase RecG
MVRTQDGFELAELDLSMRGPGEFFGTRQAGLPDFRVANLVRDRSCWNWPSWKPPVSQQSPIKGSRRQPRPSARVWARLKEAWQRRYGLVEAG